MQSFKSILPPALQLGDTIAFVSPSARLNKLFSQRLEKASRFFQQRGFLIKVFFKEDLSPDHFDSIRERCEELHKAFGDPEVKMILCTSGGLSANELLPHLDYNLIKQNPKIFCGYSDITVLHHAIFTQTGLHTFYGPAVIPEFGETPDPLKFTVDHFFQILQERPVHAGQSLLLPRSEQWTEEFLNWTSEESQQRARQLKPSPSWTWLRKGHVRGRLFGGCLPSLVQLSGTRYMPDYHGRILVIETPEQQPGTPFPLEAARTSISDLRNAGVIDVIAGLVVGRPYMYDERSRKAFEKVVVDQCYGTDFPILANVDTGHTDPMLTLPLNALVLLNSEEDIFSVHEAVVVPRPRKV